jgi:hypothetical protein
MENIGTQASPASPLSKQIEEGLNLAQFLQNDKGLPIRLFGSAAVSISCPKFRYFTHQLNRTQIQDIDLVTEWKYKPQVEREIKLYGLQQPDDFKRYRLRGRLRYFHSSFDYLVEIFHDPLNFHHALRLGHRINYPGPTIPLADLVLSKLQYEEIDKKEGKKTNDQLIDLAILLAEHMITPDDRGISIERIRFVTQGWGGWGFGNTAYINLMKLQSFVDNEIKDEDVRGRIKDRIDEVIDGIMKPPKNVGWRLRQLFRGIIPVGQTVDD